MGERDTRVTGNDEHFTERDEGGMSWDDIAMSKRDVHLSSVQYRGGTSSIRLFDHVC